MKTNQAFEILKCAGSIRAARIILNKWQKPSKFKVLIAAYRLKKNVPVAKIIHEKWFYGLPFYTNKWTLDPRPDSETLVEAVLKNHKSEKNLDILDLGTGTGCLVSAIVKNLPNATGIGIDKSWFAVRVARKNVKNLELKDKIKILHKKFNSDLKRKFDVIISNPPYIAQGDKRVDAGANHDPKMALYAKNNGLAAYKQIAKSAQKLLKENGKIYLEIGDGQGVEVRKIFEDSGWKFINCFYDLSEIERVLVFTQKTI